jgi:hypothetical protein
MSSGSSYPYYPSSICTSCWYGGYLEPTLTPVGCRACGHAGVSGGPPPPNGQNNTQIPYVSSIPIQKKIQNVVRVDSSEYLINKAALSVYTQPTAAYNYVNWNQQSDRAVPGVVHRNVPRRGDGSSTRTSITALRPGSSSAGSSSTMQISKGVDMKHGSYDRYLAKLKGRKVLRTQSYASTSTNIAEQGNKTRTFGVAYSDNCQYPDPVGCL